MIFGTDYQFVLFGGAQSYYRIMIKTKYVIKKFSNEIKRKYVDHRKKEFIFITGVLCLMQ